MKDQLICDRLIVGIHDFALPECLQLEAGLTPGQGKETYPPERSSKNKAT